MYRPFYDEPSFSLYFVDDSFADTRFDPSGTNLFLCGPLQSPEMFASFAGIRPPFAPAVAFGFDRGWETVGSERVMFMRPDDDPRRPLTGTVYLGLTDDDVRRIEGFELAGDLRRKVVIEVMVGDLTIEAITYLKR